MKDGSKRNPCKQNNGNVIPLKCKQAWWLGGGVRMGGAEWIWHAEQAKAALSLSIQATWSCPTSAPLCQTFTSPWGKMGRFHLALFLSLLLQLAAAAHLPLIKDSKSIRLYELQSRRRLANRLPRLQPSPRFVLRRTLTSGVTATNRGTNWQRWLRLKRRGLGGPGCLKVAVPSRARQ